MARVDNRRARKPRLSIELDAAAAALVRRAHAAAVLAGTTLREWVLTAIRQRLERDDQADDSGDA